MAYQFFSKAATSPPLSASGPSSSSNSGRSMPPIHPPPLVVPSSSASSSTSRPPSGADPTFQPTPYPDPISPGYPTPHPHITIDPVRTAHIPSLSRITGLLLPIRYPNSFYTATITDPVISSLSRVALYHGHPMAAAPETGSVTSSNSGGSAGTEKVIGGIRCRLERLPQEASTTANKDNADAGSGSQPRPPTNLYIQTLHLLSPYRGHGVAASLLNSLLFSTPPSNSSSSSKPPYEVSPLVKHYNIRTVTAHVHEANEEGLRWYVARGFRIDDGVVEGYYRRLKPSGAKIVKMDLEWDDEENTGLQTHTNPAESTSKTVDNKFQKETEGKEEDEDDDWEKVEAEDGDDDQEEHGVEALGDGGGESDSHILVKRKRKADEDLHS
ncbi:hypothetical protein VTN02DRAFT_961 [Thermoascus thermophilus]